MFSLTITGLIVAVLAKVLQVSGVTVGNDALTAFVATGGQIVGALIIYVGRLRQGDITWYGAKK